MLLAAHARPRKLAASPEMPAARRRRSIVASTSVEVDMRSAAAIREAIPASRVSHVAYTLKLYRMAAAGSTRPAGVSRRRALCACCSYALCHALSCLSQCLASCFFNAASRSLLGRASRSARRTHHAPYRYADRRAASRYSVVFAHISLAS